MPYVNPESRVRLQEIVEAISNCARSSSLSPGELNYLLTVLADAYIAGEGLRYASIAEAIGALECAKLELYRRIAGPYEDCKLAVNGEAYTCIEEQP